MKVSNDQIDAFAKARRDPFVREVFAYLREDAPKLSAPLDDDALLAFCGKAIDFGLANETDGRRDLARLALCLLKLRVDFELTLPPAWVGGCRGAYPGDPTGWVHEIYTRILTRMPSSAR